MSAGKSCQVPKTNVPAVGTLKLSSKKNNNKSPIQFQSDLIIENLSGVHIE